MKKFLIESYDAETDKWSKVSDTDPAYQMIVKRRRRWLFFFHEVGVIENLREAEAEAEARAIASARGLSRLGPTRVTCVTKLKSGTTSAVVSQWKQSRFGRAMEALHLQ